MVTFLGQPARLLGDGRRAYVARLLFDRGRLCIGREDDGTGFSVGY